VCLSPSSSPSGFYARGTARRDRDHRAVDLGAPAALNSARKQADRVKCLAALQQLGQAFNLYGNDNQGYWPASRHYMDVGPAATSPITGRRDPRRSA
jgi:hypothetical protein